MKILGLTLKRTEAVSHITNRINIAESQTGKLRRFAQLKTNTKLKLYKSLIRPIIEYPIVPNALALASKSQLRKMQKVQNRNVRMITCNNNMFDNMTLAEKKNSG